MSTYLPWYRDTRAARAHRHESTTSRRLATPTTFLWKPNVYYDTPKGPCATQFWATIDPLTCLTPPTTRSVLYPNYAGEIVQPRGKQEELTFPLVNPYPLKRPGRGGSPILSFRHAFVFFRLRFFY